jgi:cell division protein FtsB
MKCPNCGHMNTEGSRYCNQCAFPLNTNKVSLGQYEYDDQEIYPADKAVSRGKYREDQSRPFESVASLATDSNEGIYDRDGNIQKVRKPIVLKMTLVILLALFVFVGYNGIKFAVDTQQDRITQAKIQKEQQAQADVLKNLENYREKFNTVIVSYEDQGVIISENIKSLSTLRINRFAKGLGLGDVFNKIVNTLLDVSKVNELKSNSDMLNMLVDELMNPPETFASKYETLITLRNVENNILDTISGELTSDSKSDLEKLYEDYNQLLVDLNR